MPEFTKPLEIPRTFAEAPTAAMNAGLHLLSRRSSAIADFWRSCAEIRQPTDFMALQLNFWTQLVDDYQEALSEGMSQLSGGEPAASTSKSGQPPQTAQSA
jgi:hypothetical protein